MPNPIPKALLAFFLVLSLYPAPLQREEDESNRVRLLGNVLQERKEYELYLVESFERQRPWEIYRGVSFLNETSFVAKVPESAAFGMESELYRPKFHQTNRSSLMIHTYFENPKTGFLEIRPQEKIWLPIGIPARVFIWVFSNGYDAEMELVLHQRKSKEISFPLGRLDFHGWKRMEIRTRIPARNIRMNQSMQFPFQVFALRIRTSPFQKKGEFFIYLDQFGILFDKQMSRYPGSEIKDNWGTDF